MKTHLVSNLLAVQLSLLLVSVSSPASSFVVDSHPTNSLCVSLGVVRADQNDNSPIKLDEVLHYGLRLTTNGSARVFFPKDEYFCTFELLGADGKPAKKTPLGAKAGSHFDELRFYSHDAVRKKNRNGDLAQGRVFGDASGFKPLYLEGNSLSIANLFVIEPGRSYTLRVRFQVFLTGNNDPVRHRFLIRLPTIELPVRGEISSSGPRLAQPLPVETPPK